MAYEAGEEPVMGKTEDEASFNWAIRKMPKEFKFKFNPFLASDECPWSCTNDCEPHISGVGNSPVEAVTSWRLTKENSWYPARQERFMNLLTEMANHQYQHAPCNKMSGVAYSYREEVRKFVSDWRQGKIGVIKG